MLCARCIDTTRLSHQAAVTAAGCACSVQENWTEFKALQLWLLKKSLSRDDSFMELLLSVDILPCLTFENKEVRRGWGWSVYGCVLHMCCVCVCVTFELVLIVGAVP